MLDILPVCWQVASLRSDLVLEDFDAGVAEFSRQLVLFLHKVVFSKVDDAEWIPWVGLEGALKVMHGLLSHLIVVDI